MTVIDRAFSYNKDLHFIKELEAGNIRIKIRITPFQAETIRMEAFKDGKKVDTYIGRNELGRHDFPIVWWIERNSKSGNNWNTLLLTWWLDTVVPEIERETLKRNMLSPSAR